MSDLTSCNRCNYNLIVREAQLLGQDVELRRDVSASRNGRTDFPNGQAVYVDDKFVAWFMELPESCVCSGAFDKYVSAG